MSTIVRLISQFQTNYVNTLRRRASPYRLLPAKNRDASLRSAKLLLREVRSPPRKKNSGYPQRLDNYQDHPRIVTPRIKGSDQWDDSRWRVVCEIKISFLRNDAGDTSVTMHVESAGRGLGSWFGSFPSTGRVVLTLSTPGRRVSRGTPRNRGSNEHMLEIREKEKEKRYCIIHDSGPHKITLL